MTQQNAALVEESAAAADSLSKQAEDLLQSVALFKISGSASSNAQASHQAARKLQPTDARKPKGSPNVARPTFKRAQAAAPQIQNASTAGAHTGTEDWDSF